MKKIKLFLKILPGLFLLPINIQAQGIEISSGGSISFTGAASIEINNGGLTNNGSYSKGSEILTFSGNTPDTISGTSATDVHNLTITNTGGITTQFDQLTAYSALIASGCKFTIDPAKAVTITSTISNSAGVDGLIIKSNSALANGSLIFHNDYSFPVPATVEMYTKASKPTGLSYKWQFFGIPVRSTVASPTFDNSYVRVMHEDDSPAHWEQLNSSSTLSSFTGYEITQITSKTIYFQGNLENRDFGPTQLSYTLDATYPGQQLLSNPYAAAIDIKKIVFGSEVFPTVYLYNTGSKDDWQTATGISDTTFTTFGQYISIPQATAGFYGLPGQIPSMQGFLVIAKKSDPSATISIPYSAAGTVVKNTAMQRVKAVDPPCTIIDVKGSTNYDRMWIFTDASCSHNFDNGWDGVKFFASSQTPQICGMENDGNYQVEGVDNINNTYLGFRAGVDTTYTLSFSNQNTHSIYPTLYLVDLSKNITTDITQSGTKYTFSASNSSVLEKRFKIITNLDQTSLNADLLQNGIKVFSSQQTIFIQNQTNMDGKLSLYDISGRLIEIIPFSGNSITTKKLDLNPGSYIIRGIAGDKKISQKIII